VAAPRYYSRHNVQVVGEASHSTDGIFVAGCCEGPKDLLDRIDQAGAAAAEVPALVDRRSVEPRDNRSE
jgi:heterodisulfide reductase subunit A